MTVDRDTSRGRRGTGDGGFAGGYEALPFGVLIFVMGTLMIANAWALIDLRMAAAAGAREAARAYVEGGGDSGQAVGIGTRAFDDQRSGDGGGPAVSIVIEGEFVRCGRIVATATVSSPVLDLGIIPAFGSTEITVQHSEIVDPFRAGIGTEGEGCGA